MLREAPYKSINELMRYLRKEHKITIYGSTHKRKLRNYGYYHCYKGYRFIKKPSHRIPYSHFNEILSIYQFDMDLKSLFYPQIMFIETALKNYVLEKILDYSKTNSLHTIYETVLTNYKCFQINSKSYKRELRKRLELRNKIYSNLTRDYNNKQIVQHFYHKDRPVPIWAVFELMSLGEFGNFLSCACINAKKAVSQSLGLNQSCDTKGRLTESIIFILRDLRNAIAHNDVVFDTRFRSSTPNNALIRALQFDTGIINISFNTIVDYLVLVVYLLKHFKIPKKEIMSTPEYF